MNLEKTTINNLQTNQKSVFEKRNYCIQLYPNQNPKLQQNHNHLHR